MAEERPSTEEQLYDLSAGALCLDFTNTVGDRPRYRQEHLSDYSDLLAWGRQAQVIDGGELGQLERLASRRSGEAQKVFRQAVELRETLYRVFSSVAHGQRPTRQDLDLLNQSLVAVSCHREVIDQDGGFAWHWTGPQTALDRVLWPVIQSAADLLTSDDQEQVRECDGETCSWLFVDRSRTHRRRWCDMKVCGNRAKARRHYQRKKQEAG